MCQAWLGMNSHRAVCLLLGQDVSTEVMNQDKLGLSCGITGPWGSGRDCQTGCSWSQEPDAGFTLLSFFLKVGNGVIISLSLQDVRGHLAENRHLISIYWTELKGRFRNWVPGQIRNLNHMRSDSLMTKSSRFFLLILSVMAMLFPGP